MSRDLDIIKAEAVRLNELTKMVKALGLDVGQSELNRDFNLVARALSGEEAAKFPALRRLVRWFGRWGTIDLMFAASEKSHHKWRLIVRERKQSENPDQGKRFKKRMAESRTNKIGLNYYQYRKSGLSDLEAMQKTRELLLLNLSDSTIRQELNSFRQAAKRRGYVDSHAAISGLHLANHRREPEILVADLIRKGRPKKHTKDNLTK